MKTSPKSIHNSTYKQLILRLVSLRKKKGITQRELAKNLKTSHCYIGRTETCERRLDIIETIALCKALEMTKEEIISLIETII